jgi:hypothetical protein
MRQPRHAEREDDRTVPCAREERLLGAEGCVRLAVERLGGSDPLSEVLEDLLRALEGVGVKARTAPEASEAAGVRAGDARTAPRARAYASSGTAAE